MITAVDARKNTHEAKQNVIRHVETISKKIEEASLAGYSFIRIEHYLNKNDPFYVICKPHRAPELSNFQKMVLEHFSYHGFSHALEPYDVKVGGFADDANSPCEVEVHHRIKIWW